MNSFAVEPAELDQCSATLDDAATALGAVSAQAPDPSMYGELVGGAAADVEPAATESINALLDALSRLHRDVAARCGESAASYRRTEADAAEHARREVRV